MATDQLFLATNLLETCRGWQEVISSIPDKEGKDAAGQHALSTIRSHDFHGENTVVVKTDLALMMEDGSSQEEMLWPIQEFSNLRLMGHLGKVAYLSFPDQGLISWRLVDARVVDPLPEPTIVDDMNDDSLEFPYYLPVERKVRRSIYLPVSMIDYALPASN